MYLSRYFIRKVIQKFSTCFLLLLNIHTVYGQVTRDSVHFKTLEERLAEHPRTDTVSTPVLLNSGRHPTHYVTDKRKQWLVGGTSVILWAGSFIALNKAWYTDYERTSFHFFNDNKEWNQIDKIGHVWTSYHLSRVSTAAWRWTGIKDKTSILLGAFSGVAYQTIIEIQDGYSNQWGFSWGDMGSNFIGSGMYALQELKWKEQRLTFKFSYWPYHYDTELMERRNQMFGKTFMERILKDYNAQTYWLSANIHSFFPDSRWPVWLNVSFGYSSDGMLGGKENVWKDRLGNRVERPDIPRIRHYYISPDIDFSKIHTNRKLVRKIFFLLNAVKIPAPAVELNSKGRFKVHALQF